MKHHTLAVWYWASYHSVCTKLLRVEQSSQN